jgi:hypothetical protein
VGCPHHCIEGCDASVAAGRPPPKSLRRLMRKWISVPIGK